MRTNYYSVPVRLVGGRVRVLLHASELVVFDGRVEVTRHERLLAKSAERLELDHYLEALLRKPAALPGATALEQARAAGKFTPVYDAWWAAVNKAQGDRDGTRALIQVLLLHRHMTHEHVVAGLAAEPVWSDLAGNTAGRQVVVAANPRPPHREILHSIPVGTGRGDIDHVVIGPPGVFTINTKHHPGRRLDVGAGI